MDLVKTTYITILTTARMAREEGRGEPFSLSHGRAMAHSRPSDASHYLANIFPGSPKFTQAKKECSDVSLIIHEESVLTDYSRQCIKRLACLEPNASSELLIPIDDT